VLADQVDAAGVELRILHRLEAEGTVPTGALRVVEETLVEGYPWVMRGALGPQARTALVDAFTAIDDPDLLELMRAESYAEVQAEDYVAMHEHAEELGLLTVEE
jgi:phosphonate transport system substrate-binding protein